ncbi:spore-associated protein A [Nonomuraea sp. NPDC005650]|uniref:spore-associated protein A n=1 Tax=Nonomuraea sp. NPDC005650 TaxID=3157045 RepID=UPI0033B47EE8
MGILTTPAMAAAYTPEGLCGSGYHVVDSLPLKHRTLSGTGGRVYLLYNNSTGYNCAVTIKSVAVGTATNTAATILVQTTGDNFTRHEDDGDYKSYAGPVRVKAADKCVEVLGHTFSTASRTSYYAIIPWGHCGS